MEKPSFRRSCAVLMLNLASSIMVTGCATSQQNQQQTNSSGNSAQVEQRNCNLAMAAGFLTPGTGGFAMEMNQATKNYNQCRGN